MKNLYRSNLNVLTFAIVFTLFAVTALPVTLQAKSNDTISTSFIRVLHLSPDAPDVDIFVDRSVKAVERLAFQEGTGYLELPEGMYSFDIVPSEGAKGNGVESSVLTIEDLPLKGGDYVTAVAYGKVSDLQAMALVDERPSEFGDAGIRIRAIHTAAGVGEVDILLVTDPGGKGYPLWTGVSFGDAGNYLTVPEGAYSLGIDVNADAVPDLVYDIPFLFDGTVANVFAVRDTSGSVFLLAQLDDGSLIKIDARRNSAWIRAIHLSAETDSVDVLAFGEFPVFIDLSYTESTKYLGLEPGMYDLDIVKSKNEKSLSLLSISGLELDHSTDYTAVAYGTGKEFTVMTLVDDNSEMMDNTIRVRAIHTAWNVDDVDLWLLESRDGFAPIWRSLGYGESTDYFELPARAFSLGLDLDSDAVNDVIFDIPALPSGSVINAFANTGLNDDVVLIAQFQDGHTVKLPARPDPANARLRVLHLSPDAPAVDIYVDGTKAAGKLEFKSGTGYLELFPGTYWVDVRPVEANTDCSPLSVELTLESGMDYTAVAYGKAGDLTALALMDDNSHVTDGRVRIRAIHTAVGVGDVDIWTAGPAIPMPLYRALGFGEAGEYLEIDSKPVTLGFNTDRDTAYELMFDIPALPKGSMVNVFAVTEKSGKILLVAQFPDGSLVDIGVKARPVLTPVTDVIIGR